MKQNQLTRHQQSILQLLKLLDRPTSAQEIYTQLLDRDYSIGLATVYRSLEVLKLQGLVQNRAARNGESLYSLAEQGQHYLTCLQCGKSIPMETCPICSIEAQLQRSASFKIYYHTLEFFGLCEPCTQKANP